MDSYWEQTVLAEGSIGMDGSAPYAGETITIRLRARHARLGVITDLDPEEGDSIAYEVAYADGTVWAGGYLDPDEHYANGEWSVDIATPSEPGVFVVRWTVVYDGAIGRARTTFKTEAF